MFNHLLRKIFGIYQKPYSESWDKLLNDILDHGQIISASRHTVNFEYQGCEFSVWNANKYYAYGYLYRLDGYDINDENKFRPKFKTMKRFSKRIQDERNSFFDKFLKGDHIKKAP